MLLYFALAPYRPFIFQDDRVGFWPYRLTVRTSAFQAGNPGAIPGRVTATKLSAQKSAFFVR